MTIAKATDYNPGDLIAGKTTDVGDIEVTNDANYLYVKYSTVDGWVIKETHLDVQTDKAYFPTAGKQKNLVPGKFAFQNEHDPVVLTYTYKVPLSNYGDAEKLYIAAHAVVGHLVECDGDCDDCFVNLDYFAYLLPEKISASFTNPYTKDSKKIAYWKTYVTTEGEDLIPTGYYEGWCVDTWRSISGSRTLNVYSFYETLPTGAVDKPNNLPKVNWLLNQNFVGTSSGSYGDYTYSDVQVAIWILIDDTTEPYSVSGLGTYSEYRVEQLVEMADEHDDYVPGCGEKVGLVLVPFNSNGGIGGQVTAITVDQPCFCYDGEETAWGSGVRFNSKGNWATYFWYELE